MSWECTLQAGCMERYGHTSACVEVSVCSFSNKKIYEIITRSGLQLESLIHKGVTLNERVVGGPPKPNIKLSYLHIRAVVVDYCSVNNTSGTIGVSKLTHCLK